MSSSAIGSALRSATATASCAGVSVRREKDPLDRFLFRRILQAVRRVAAIRDAVALAPSPRRSNRRRARGSVQIVCASSGKPLRKSSDPPDQSLLLAPGLFSDPPHRRSVPPAPSPAHCSPGSPPAPWFAIALEPVAQQWLTVVAWL
jgi:hypothetical protein